MLALLLLVSAPFARASSFSPADEQEIVRLVNAERRSRGLSTLIIDERLTQAARKHSARMAAVSQVEHQVAGEPKLALRLGEYAIRYDVSGENVAFAANAARAHTALMNSPGHRANILDLEYNAIGIGVLRTPDGIYVTQDFARRLPEASVDDAEAQVVLQLNRMRRAAGMPMLNRVPAPALRARACEMAAKDKLDPHAGMSTKVSNSIAFTAIDLTQIPESIQRLQGTTASGFSVGACYQSSRSYENPVFWMIVVTYF